MSEPFRRDRGVRVRTAAALAVALASVACGGAREVDGLRVGLGYDFPSLDPHLSNTNASVEQLSNVYEPLVALDPDLRVVPCLATSWSSPDPLTWVFRLRPGVRFHDGSTFAAEDVVHSLTRLLGDETLEVRSFLAGVEAVTAQADGTVRIRTGRPRALLLNGLSFVPIVRRGASGGAFEAGANGTGPYRVESWIPRKELRLARHEAYWGPKPLIRSVTVELGLTDEATRAGFAAGRFGLLRAGFPGIEDAARRDPRYRSIVAPNIFLRYLGFDVESETTPACPGIPNPFRRREVREAIHLALDRGALAARVGPEAVPAAQIVPAAVFGHDPQRTLEPPDPERARRLLAGAGLVRPDGPGGPPSAVPLVLHRPSGFSKAAEAVAAQLASVGLSVTVRSLPSADFFAAARRRELGFWIAANGCASGDALEVLWDSFHTADPSRGAGVDNYAGFRDAEVDRGIEEAAAILEAPRRLPLLQKLLARVLAERVWIPLYHNKDLTILARDLTLRPRADLLLRYAEIGRAGGPGDP